MEPKFKHLLIFLAAIAVSTVLIMASSCHTLKTIGHNTRDSVVIRTHDSTIYTTVTNTKDSVVLRDSLVTVMGDVQDFALPFNSDVDTIIKKGSLRIISTVHNGVRTTHVDCGEKDILIEDLRVVVHREKQSNDSLSNVINEIRSQHVETVIKQEQKTWFGRLFDELKTCLFWVAIIIVAWWAVKKFVLKK